jgi:alkanesulfonate monooxygenase SsuD/methylene tetrahydromethanopterin reductase-like flavin-dependent oxidoreductase (luciferase family)
MHFDAVETPEASTPRVAETKHLALERGRDIQVWTPVGIICRPTQKEADDYLQYVVDRADWGAIGHLADMHAKEGRGRSDPQRLVHSGHNPLARRALARGSYCVVGDPDALAREFWRLSAAGLDGLAVNFVDYLKELPYLAAEVLPRLEKLGLRAADRAET